MKRTKGKKSNASPQFLTSFRTEGWRCLLLLWDGSRFLYKKEKEKKSENRFLAKALLLLFLFLRLFKNCWSRASWDRPFLPSFFFLKNRFPLAFFQITQHTLFLSFPFLLGRRTLLVTHVYGVPARIASSDVLYTKKETVLCDVVAFLSRLLSQNRFCSEPLRAKKKKKNEGHRNPDHGVRRRCPSPRLACPAGGPGPVPDGRLLVRVRDAGHKQRGNGEQRNVARSRGRAGGQLHAWMDRPVDRWFEVLPHPRVAAPEHRLHPAMEHRGGFVHEVLVRGPPVGEEVRHLHERLQVRGMLGRGAERGIQGLPGVPGLDSFAVRAEVHQRRGGGQTQVHVVQEAGSAEPPRESRHGFEREADVRVAEQRGRGLLGFLACQVRDLGIRPVQGHQGRVC